MRTRGKSAFNLHPPNTQNVTRFPRDTENLATGPAPPAGGPTMASRASDGTHGRYPSQAWVDSDPRPFGRSRSLRALLTGASRARSGDVLLAKRERRIPAASTSCRSSVFAGSSRLSELPLQPCPAICCFHRASTIRALGRAANVGCRSSRLAATRFGRGPSCRQSVGRGVRGRRRSS
jgi:hypothetical protein